MGKKTLLAIEKLNENGYSIIKNTLNTEEIHLIDSNGFKYKASVLSVLSDKKPSKIGRGNPYTIENTKIEIKLRGIDSELIFSEYTSATTKMKWKCNCGSIFKKTLSEIYKAPFCKKCQRLINGRPYKLSFEEVKRDFNNRNYTVCFEEFNNSHELLKVIDENGYIGRITFNSFKNGNRPRMFHTSNPYTIANIKKFLKNNNTKTILLSEEYNGIFDKLAFKCECGNIFYRNMDTMLKYNSTRIECLECNYNNKRGSKNVKWNGESEIKKYLRAQLSEWRKESLKISDKKCAISGLNSNTIHHVYSFNDIFHECIENTNIEIKEKTGEYSEIELLLLKNEILKLHRKYGYGICLEPRIHIRFHMEYGHKNITKEDYINFKEDYKKRMDNIVHIVKKDKIFFMYNGVKTEVLKINFKGFSDDDIISHIKINILEGR